MILTEFAVRNSVVVQTSSRGEQSRHYVRDSLLGATPRADTSNLIDTYKDHEGTGTFSSFCVGVYHGEGIFTGVL